MRLPLVYVHLNVESLRRLPIAELPVPLRKNVQQCLLLLPEIKFIHLHSEKC